jgi:prepilin-type N-terminal cleavage/methylation domain-containing protein
MAMESLGQSEAAGMGMAAHPRAAAQVRRRFLRHPGPGREGIAGPLHRLARVVLAEDKAYNRHGPIPHHGCMVMMGLPACDLRSMAAPRASHETGSPPVSSSSLRCGGQRRFMRPEAMPMASSRAAREAGFSLIELLVVIAIIGVLMGLLMPVLILVRERARTRQAVQSVSQLMSSLELYAAEDDRKRYPYPGPFPGNTNPYGPAATTYFRFSEAGDPERAFALAFTDDDGGTMLTGVLSLLDAKKLPLPLLLLDNGDPDRRLLDPWGHPYHYRLSLPKATRAAFACTHGSGVDLGLKDWNWDATSDRESLRSGLDPAKARPYPYVYSWGRRGSASDPCTWIYQADHR